MGKTAYPRLLEPPGSSFFLFGPRGSGKSSWARQHFSGARVFDLLDEPTYLALLADPGRFADDLGPIASGEWVIVDEIQRVPALLNEVHRSIEDRGLRFVLLGSSARKLKTAGTNLLAGRATLKEMYPFTPEELGDDFDLTRALSCGTLPLVWSSEEPKDALEAYVQLYLREEIRAEALVRQLPGFVRFLPVAGLMHAQKVNVSGIARDSMVSRDTVTTYLEILEDTLLAIRLPAYEARLRLRERKHPKLYWIDPGIVRAVKGQLGQLTDEEKGPLLEGYVLTVLRASRARHELYEEIAYWAPSAGRLEVDFLLRRDGEFLAIEVKAGRTVGPQDLRGLKAIADLDGVARRVLIYGGTRTQITQDGVDIWPLAVFADALREDRLWP